MSMGAQLALIVCTPPGTLIGIICLLHIIRVVDEARAARRALPQDHEHVEGDYR